MKTRKASHGWACAIAVFVCLAKAGADSLASTIVVQDDALVVNSAPDTNLGTDRIGTWTAYTSQLFGRSYLKFPLGGQPPATQVESVTLFLYQYDAGGFVPTVNLYHVNDDAWTESAVTWNNRPSPNPAPADLLTSMEIGFEAGWKSLDLLASGLWDYDADVADGYLSLLLRSNENGDERHNFYSKDEDAVGDYRPYLEVQLIPEPATGALIGLAALGLTVGRKPRGGKGTEAQG